MIEKKERSGGKISGYLAGALTGMITAVFILYILNISGIISISSVGKISVAAFLGWCYGNLGLSIIPFSLIAFGYVLYLKRFIQLLETQGISSKEIFTMEEKIDLFMNLFFGVGVIWTAIGMRSALLASLGNMDAETAAQKGAFYILTQLVEGGILLSLSTTIVGGIGGYLMRIIKAWATGPKLNAFVDSQIAIQNHDVLDRLDKIAQLIKEKSQGKAAC